jgi:hypothetical protein
MEGGLGRPVSGSSAQRGTPLPFVYFPFFQRSNEWSMLGDKERQQLGLTFDDDGEFWMAFNDFVRNFHKLEICLLTPGTLSESRGRKWEVTTEDGSWMRRVNAGGCRNYLGESVLAYRTQILAIEYHFRHFLDQSSI